MCVSVWDRASVCASDPACRAVVLSAAIFQIIRTAQTAGADRG
jgi:hypothetical protein